MCGIGSISFSKKVNAKDVDLEKGISELITELDSRGRDACGMFTLNAKGLLHVQKAAVRAYEFNKGRIECPEGTRAVAVHTRMATQGNKGFMRNNHPVQAGDAFVIHNGVVDDSDTQRLQGHPEVDTFALAVAAMKCEPRADGESVKEHALRVALAMAQIEGSAAVIAAYQGIPMLVCARLTGSPLLWSDCDGIRITASTRKAIEKCADGLGIQLPKTTETVEKTIKGKNGAPDVVETKTIELEDVFAAYEGSVLTWSGTGHNRGAIEIPERTASPKSWRRYLQFGDTGEYTPPSRPKHSSHYDSWGTFDKSTEEKDPDDSSVTITTRHYSKGWKSITRYRDRQFLSSTTVPPPKPTEPHKNPDVHSVAGRELYPIGTPWPPNSSEGESFARSFSVWRRSNHGAKWARENANMAAAYDAAAARRKSNGLTPPFPAPAEVVKMLADPLFQRVPDGFEVAGDTGTRGTQIERFTSDAMEAAVQRMLARASTADDSGFKACQVCGDQSDSFKDTPDGEMCEECERLWMWSEYQAR